MKGAIKLGLRPTSRWPCRNLPGDNDRDFVNGSVCYWQAAAGAGKSGSQQTQPSLLCRILCEICAWTWSSFREQPPSDLPFWGLKFTLNTQCGPGSSLSQCWICTGLLGFAPCPQIPVIDEGEPHRVIFQNYTPEERAL